MSAWGRSLSDFFTSRVARLFPAYWFAVILTALVLLDSGLTSGNPLESSPTNILLNLTMAQQGSGGIDLDPSYWTLWYEMRFYLLFAIVVLLGVTYRRVVAFCALWTVATIIAATSDDKLAELVTMFRYAPYFIAGVALFVIYKYGSNLLLWGIVGFNYLLALSRIRSQADGQFGGSGVEPNTTTLCLVLTLCFAVMALVALRLLDRVQWRWLTVAGALTYPLYLMHQVIGFSLINTVTCTVRRSKCWRWPSSPC
jgi:peptidoglycan/LPS O-acetylase OafA/YrhL